MEKFTDGTWIVSPMNSNLVISGDTHESVAIVMSGNFNGIAFTQDRVVKQNNAKLIARSKDMYDFLAKLGQLLPKNDRTTAFGNCRNEYIDDKNTIGEMIEKLLKL